MSAQNASELSEALETAVEIPAELPTGKLSVKVTAEGKLQDSFLKITNTNTGEELKGQRTYSKSNTNPRIVSLPDGIYDLEVSPIRMKGVESRKITGIEIKEGEVVEKEVDFGFGELSIKVVRNGKLMDSTVYVYKLETEETVAKGRTYNSSGSNPIVLKLDPGVYDISIKALEIETRPTQKLDAVEIVSGEKVEKVVDYSSGTLKIGALQGEKFVDATIHIKDPDTGEQVAKGRTDTSSKSNPKVFDLDPGMYDIEVSAVKIVGKPSQEFTGIELTGEESVEKIAQFSSGVLKVGAVQGDVFVDSIATIKDSRTGEQITSGRTYTDYKSFVLVPGFYTVIFKALKIEGNPEKTLDVEVKAQETAQVKADFAN